MKLIRASIVLGPLLAATALLAACETTAPLAPPPPPPPPPPPIATGAPVFRTADFAWATSPGAGRIEGRLVVGRGQFTCSGGSVILMPETPWVRARMQQLYGATTGAVLPAAEVRARTPKAPDALNPYVRSTACDAQSRFGFAGLANGAWYIITVAKAIVPGRGEETAIMRRVTIVDGRPVSLEL
jgi:hypothetical protein